MPAAQFVVQALTPDNYVSVLTPLLDRGGFLVNLSVEVSSAALIRLSQQTGTLYIDTCSEPWKGNIFL